MAASQGTRRAAIHIPMRHLLLAQEKTHGHLSGGGFVKVCRIKLYFTISFSPKCSPLLQQQKDLRQHRRQTIMMVLFIARSLYRVNPPALAAPLAASWINFHANSTSAREVAMLPMAIRITYWPLRAVWER